MDINDLAQLPKERLAEMWCELNKWQWPSELGEPINDTIGSKIMRAIEAIVDDDRLISRFWNHNMTNEEFEKWWKDHKLNKLLGQRVRRI